MVALTCPLRLFQIKNLFHICSYVQSSKNMYWHINNKFWIFFSIVLLILVFSDFEDDHAIIQKCGSSSTVNFKLLIALVIVRTTNDVSCFVLNISWTSFNILFVSITQFDEQKNLHFYFICLFIWSRFCKNVKFIYVFAKSRTFCPISENRTEDTKTNCRTCPPKVGRLITLTSWAFTF